MPTITVDIKAIGGDGFMREMQRSADALGRTFPQAARQAEAQIGAVSKALETQAAVMARVKSQAVGLFAGAIGVSAVAGFTRSIVESTNALIGWENSFKGVSPNAMAASQAMAFVRSEADRLGLSLESSAAQFAKLTAATRGTSLEGENTRKIFTAVSEAARVLNLSTESTEGAFRALEQMVSKGKVQAEELRGQLGERLPGAFRLAAEAMGVTTAQLNKMLELGQVTAEDLLPKLADRLRDVYGAAAVNAANSPAAEFNRLRNAVFDLNVAIGESGVMQALTSGARQATDALRGLVESGGIDRIASSLGTIATATALAFGGRSLQAMGAYVSGLRDSVTQSAAAAKAAESAAIAKARLAQADATAAGNALLYANQVMRASVGTEHAAVAAKQLEAARIAQIRTNQALVIAERELAVAQAQSAASATLGAATMTKLAGAGKAAFALIGGWPTVILAAAYAAYQLWDAFETGGERMEAALSDADNVIQQNERSLARLEAEMRGVDDSMVDVITSFTALTAESMSAQRTLVALTEGGEGFSETWTAMAAKLGPAGGALGVWAYEAGMAENAIDNASAAQDRMIESSLRVALAQAQMAQAQGENSDALNVAVDAYLRSGATFDQVYEKLKLVGGELEYLNSLWQDAPDAVSNRTTVIANETDKIIAKYSEEAEAIGLTGSALKALQVERDAMAAATAEEAQAIREAGAALVERMKKEEAARKATMAGANEVRDSAAALRAYDEEARRAAESIAKFEQELLQMAAALSGPVAQEQAAYESQLLELERRVLAGEISVTQYYEALELVEKGHRRAADAAAEQEDVLGRLNRSYDEQIRLLGMTADQRRVEEAALQAISEWESVYGRKIDETTEAMLRQAVASGELRVKIAEDARKAADEYESVWKNAANGVGDALTTALFDGADAGADAIKDVMENLARDLVQFWLRQKIIIPLQQQITGSGPGFGGAGGNPFAAFGNNFGRPTGFTNAAGGLNFGNIAQFGMGAFGVYSAFRNGPGGILGGAQGALSGASAGATLGPAGTIVGAIIGGLSGILGGRGKPRFRVADRENDARSSSRLDDVIGVARDNMESGSATALANAIKDFDNAIADFLSGDELARVRDALDNWTLDVSGSAATAENVLGQRFGAILATFDQDVQAYVNAADTLEERTQRLAEALSWDDQIDAILGGLRRDRTLAGMDEAARQAFLVNEQFDALAEQMTAMHATAEQLAELETLRADALERLNTVQSETVALLQFQEDAARDYAATVADINRQLAEASGASEFQLALQDIALGLNANISRLNETARAAGLLSAREEDLGRAHLLAAAQAARAIAQLEQAGRALAADLYGSDLGDIEAEIARIEAESSGASSAIRDMGSAMTEMAEAANRATDLLLGDLSPLRDRQKLPLALQALQRGEIQAEQVLEIGRRLFASGADYNQLFAQVLAIENGRGGTARVTGGGGGGGAATGTDARLEALRERQRELEDAARQAQRFTQASDLAQIVADLAGARGEDFGTVLSSLSGGRATLEQFASDLGLDNLGALNDYLTALQADSYGIADIAATVTAGDQLIVDTLRSIFDYQTDIEGKPSYGDGDYRKPNLLADAATPEPIVVAPPTEPTPGETIIEERIGDLDNRIGQVHGLLAELLGQIANNTGRMSESIGKNASSAASWEAGAKPRSTRSQLVKPGY